MLLDAVPLALIIGLIAGGRLGRLKDLELRALGLFVLAAAARLSVVAIGVRGSPLAPAVGPGLLIASYLALLTGLWLNRHLRPLWVIGVGVLLNSLVIAANGGSMPGDRALAVRAGDMEMVRLLDSPRYTLHKPLTARTRLAPLGDVLPLPMLYPRPKWYCPGSIGDILVTFGACAALLQGMGAFGLGKAIQSAREGP